MALTKKNISIGSGTLYLVELTSAMTDPTVTTYDVEANRLGDIKDGATITYTPEYYEAKDDLGRVSKTSLVSEELIFKSGVITWNMDTINKLVATGEVEDEESQGTPTGKKTLSLGGIGNADIKDYLLRFVHQDGKQKIGMVVNAQAALELVYKKEQETAINAEFKALPMPSTMTNYAGRLMVYEDSTDVE